VNDLAAELVEDVRSLEWWQRRAEVPCWYYETVLAPGQAVTVFGRARFERDPLVANEGGYRGRGRRCLVIEAPSLKVGVLVSVLPKTSG
jgi:hypothetical protein